MSPPPEALGVLYEDDELLAVAKPAGLHVFPSRRGARQSVWSRLKEMRPGLDGVGDPVNPAIAHRLDRGTSGVLLVAKNDTAYRRLREAFELGEVEKLYLALLEGELDRALDVDLPLGSRYRRSAKVQVQLPGRSLRGVREARTTAEPLGTADGLTLCRVRIHTGVRHQIRAHLSHMNLPVAGDGEYGARREIAVLADRFFLHAWRVRLPHPAFETRLSVTCPPPEDLLEMLEVLGLETGEP